MWSSAGILSGAILERLTHVDGVGLRAHLQPVAGLLALTGDDLEAAIRRDRQVPGIEVAGGLHGAARGVPVDDRADAQIVHRAARTGDAVVAARVDRTAQVAVVGVVRAELDGLVGGAAELRELRVAKLQKALQPAAQQAGEIAIALGLIEGVLRGALALEYAASRLERIAEFVPHAAVDDLLLRIRYRHALTPSSVDNARHNRQKSPPPRRG